MQCLAYRRLFYICRIKCKAHIQRINYPLAGPIRTIITARCCKSYLFSVIGIIRKFIRIVGCRYSNYIIQPSTRQMNLFIVIKTEGLCDFFRFGKIDPFISSACNYDNSFFICKFDCPFISLDHRLIFSFF
ncbi:hypothetical protein D3C87_1795080 [compost metagenome]